MGSSLAPLGYAATSTFMNDWGIFFISALLFLIAIPFVNYKLNLVKETYRLE